jgi:hypothetical protein
MVSANQKEDEWELLRLSLGCAGHVLVVRFEYVQPFACPGFRLPLGSSSKPMQTRDHDSVISRQFS